MGWADRHIAHLRAGNRIVFRPTGDSMRPLIHSGDRVTLEPVGEHTPLATGDIVLCAVGAQQLLHRIGEVRFDVLQAAWRIENASGHVNGWVFRDAIYGRVVRVESGPSTCT